MEAEPSQQSSRTGRQKAQSPLPTGGKHITKNGDDDEDDSAKKGLVRSWQKKRQAQKNCARGLHGDGGSTQSNQKIDGIGLGRGT